MGTIAGVFVARGHEESGRGWGRFYIEVFTTVCKCTRRTFYFPQVVVTRLLAESQMRESSAFLPEKVFNTYPN